MPLPAKGAVLKAATCKTPGVPVLGVTVQPLLSVSAVLTLTRLSTAGLKVRRKS